MIKLQIGDLNIKNCSVSVNHHIQTQVQGGFNVELFNLLEQNKNNILAFYGNIPPNAFGLNIVIDLGKNNQILQSPY